MEVQNYQRSTKYNVEVRKLQEIERKQDLMLEALKRETRRESVSRLEAQERQEREEKRLQSFRKLMKRQKLHNEYTFKLPRTQPSMNERLFLENSKRKSSIDVNQERLLKARELGNHFSERNYVPPQQQHVDVPIDAYEKYEKLLEKKKRLERIYSHSVSKSAVIPDSLPKRYSKVIGKIGRLESSMELKTRVRDG